MWKRAKNVTSGGGAIDLSQCEYAKKGSWASGTTWEITVSKKPRAVFFSYAAGGSFGYYLFTPDDDTHTYRQQYNSVAGYATVSSIFTDNKVTLNRLGQAAYDCIACIVY